MRSCKSTRSPRANFLLYCLALGLALSLHQAGAQEPEIDEGGYKLVLEKVPDIEPGKASLLSGSTGPEGDKFFVEHLTMFQPVTVVLIAADPERPAKLSLAKYRYDEVVWSGDTGEEGAVSHYFRTQGELKIHVTPVDDDPEAETAYGLIVWAADIPGPELPPPVVIAGESEASSGFPLWLKLLAGVVVLGGIALVFFRMGRRS
jgi:hypothetical protein